MAGGEPLGWCGGCMYYVALEEGPRLQDLLLPGSPLPRRRATPHLERLDLPKCHPLLLEVLSALKEGRCRGEEVRTLLPQIELGKNKKEKDF